MDEDEDIVLRLQTAITLVVCALILGFGLGYIFCLMARANPTCP